MGGLWRKRAFPVAATPVPAYSGGGAYTIAGALFPINVRFFRHLLLTKSALAHTILIGDWTEADRRARPAAAPDGARGRTACDERVKP